MALGSVIWVTESMTCQASRRWRTATTSRLYSSASSRARSVTCSSTVSTSTQRAAPGPVTPLPMRPRSSALRTAAGAPPLKRPTRSTLAMTPYDA